MRIKRIGTFAAIALAFLICIPLAPSFARRFHGEFSGAALRVDTQIESPAQDSDAQTLAEKNVGDTIQFQLFVPAGGGRTTNGFTVELDLPGKTFSSFIGNTSGRDWSGSNLISKGNALSALFLSGATVPPTGYIAHVKLEVSRALEDGATLIIKSASMTSGTEVDKLDVSNAVISFAAASACPGDFDNSGSVDLADFLVFAGAFGTGSSDANYDARMDLDSNGSVDLGDFLRFAGVFGTQCPDGNGNRNGNGNDVPTPTDGDITTWNLPQNAIARLGKGTLSGRSYTIAYSPDGSKLAVGSHAGIWLYDTENWEEQALISGHTGQVISVAFSPNGERIASGSADSTVRLWDVARLTEIAQFHGHTDRIYSVAFSPDGTKIASGSYIGDGTVRIWDVSTQTEIARLQGYSYIFAVAFSPDGSKLAASDGGGDGMLRVWDVQSQSLIAEQRHGTAASLAFSPDGSVIGASRTEGELGTADFSLWNYAQDQGFVAYWIDNINGTYSLAFSPNGETFAVGPTTINDPVSIWRDNIGSVIHITSLEGHTGAVTSLTYSPDGSELAVVDSWNKVRVWDLQSETQNAVLKFPDTFYSIAVSPDGKTIAAGVYGSTRKNGPKDQTVRLWDVATRTEVGQLQGHSEIVYSVAFSPDGSVIASGSADNAIRLWDSASRRETAQLSGHSGFVNFVAFSPDGTKIASGSADNTVRLWDVATRRETAQLRGHSETVCSVAFSPNGSTLASGSEDGTIRLWDVTTSRETAQLRGHTGTVYSVAFSPNGSTLATGSEDGTIRLWDATTQRETAELRGHSGTVHSVSFSPDGSKIVSGATDKTVRLWDVASQRLIAIRHGHNNTVTSVVYLPDGLKVASGSADGMIFIWESGSPSQPVGPGQTLGR